MRTLIICIVLCITAIRSLFAQQDYIDSLVGRANNEHNDTIKFVAFRNVAKDFMQKLIQIALIIIQKKFCRLRGNFVLSWMKEAR